jgi:hypothetical protein
MRHSAPQLEGELQTAVELVALASHSARPLRWHAIAEHCFVFCLAFTFFSATYSNFSADLVAFSPRP